MKMIALPDLHDNVNTLTWIDQALSAVDLVLLVGDLTNGGSAADAERVVCMVRKYNSSILAVPGNWDTPEVEGFLTQEGINLHRRHLLIDGLALIGMGAALPGPVQTPNECTEADFGRFFEEATAGLDLEIPSILVCHQPPYGTRNDLAQGSVHAGSRIVRQFIERRQPLICFTGHIHEGKGIDQVGETRVINPGPLCQSQYAYAEVTSQGLEVLEIRRMECS
jgi:uncharacterized protein